MAKQEVNLNLFEGLEVERKKWIIVSENLSIANTELEDLFACSNQLNTSEMKERLSPYSKFISEGYKYLDLDKEKMATKECSMLKEVLISGLSKLSFLETHIQIEMARVNSSFNINRHRNIP